MKNASKKTITMTSAEFRRRAHKTLTQYVDEQIALARSRAERLAALQSGALIAKTVRVTSYMVPAHRVRSHDRIIATKPKESIAARAKQTKLSVLAGGKS